MALDRLWILLQKESQLPLWQKAAGAWEAACTVAVMGAKARASLEEAVRGGADYYILLPGERYSPAEFEKVWPQRGGSSCLVGQAGKGFAAWLDRVLLSYFTMRWLPTGNPAFVLLRADRLSPLLDCLPEKGEGAAAFLSAAAVYMGLSVKAIPCAPNCKGKSLFTWFLLHLFSAYGPYLHAGERMRMLEPSGQGADHGYHTAFEKLLSLVNHEFVSYVFFGLLTTVVSMGSFYVFNELLGTEVFLKDKNYLAANALSWVAAVLFAFVTNKIFVFRSKSWRAAVLGKEFAGFVSARLFSLLVDMGLMYLFVSLMGMGEMLAKFIVQIVIVILNYVFSKLFIFRKKE